MNKSTWQFKDAFIGMLQQWQLMLILFVVGSGIGWLIAELIPASYQASSSLYIGLETYRAYSDPAFSAYANQEYSNQDDYKNWQMSQLNELILARDFLEETLARLQKQDAGWKGTTIKSLHNILAAEWRTAGRWNLIARHSQRNKAEEAVLVWQQVVLEKTNQAITNAQEMIKIDIQLQAIREQEAQAKARCQKLQAVLDQIKKLSNQLQQLPPQEPLAPSMRWQVLAPPSLAADFSPAWIALLNKVPHSRALPADYLDWLAETQALSADEVQVLLGQREYFNRQFKVEYERYLSARKDSRGLSPNLIVEKVSPDDDLEVIQPRPHGQFALVGGLLGWIAFFVYQLMTLQFQTAGQEKKAHQ